MKSEINKLIDEKLAGFKASSAEMVSQYNGENATTGSYNGRQVLELLQNCDDEGAELVQIEVNREEGFVFVSNTGRSFSIKGYKSLLYPNLSGKNKKNYIGNKGLGFRSLLNWSTCIEIVSNNLLFKISNDNRIRVWEELFSKDEQETIRREYEIGEHHIPIPLLAVPEKSIEVSPSDFATTIKIYFEDSFYDDVISQLNAITAETILFLRNIKEIRFKGLSDKEDISCRKVVVAEEESLLSQRIYSSDNEWLIYSEDELIPLHLLDEDSKNNNLHYQIKVAIEKDFKNSSEYLYSFFPTNILLKQPYILHATFDLDPSRNQIIKSNLNEFLLERIAKFILKIAEEFKRNELSYNALRLIYHEHRADTLSKHKYYEYFDQFLKDKQLYPTISGEYFSRDTVFYQDEEFVGLLLACNAEKIFWSHLLSFNTIDQQSVGLTGIRSVNHANDFIRYLNEVFCLPLTINQRVDLIKYVINAYSFKQKLTRDVKYGIAMLTDKAGNPIKGSDHIYTPPTNNLPIKVPNFAHIEFINEELFSTLLESLGYYDDSQHEKDRGRFVSRKLSEYCNVHSYEPTTLVEKIIGATVSHQYGEGFKDKVIEMHQCLYHNYLQLSESTKNTTLEVVYIPAINLEGKVKSSKKLTFSSNYPFGKNAQLIFGNLLAGDKLVGTKEDFGFAGETETQIGNYLKWLGVNEFLAHKRIDYISNYNNSYINYVKTYKSVSGKEANYLVFEYEDFLDVVRRLDITKFLYWIISDKEIYRQLNILTQTDEFKLTGHGQLIQFPSYLRFVVDEYTSFKFADFLVDDQLSWINDFYINYNDQIFISNGITRQTIDQVLIALGAVTDFNSLSISRVEKVLEQLPEKFPDGTNAQNIYRKALAHFRVNKRNLSNNYLRLFAHNGDDLEVYFNRKIYFSDKIKLPRKLRKHYPIFYFPLRAGGAEAITFFGINDLKNLRVEIVDNVEVDDLTHDFNTYLDRLRPYLLAIRILNVDNRELKERLADSLSKLQVSLCEKLSFRIDDKIEEVDCYEFLYAENKCFIKINPSQNLTQIRKANKFLETLAEVISNVFDLSTEKVEYKNLFRGAIDEVISYFEDDYGTDFLNEAKVLLGLTDQKFAFWKAVFESKDLAYDDKLPDNLLIKKIDDELKIYFNPNLLNYDYLNNIDSLKQIRQLFHDLKIDDVVFDNNYAGNLNFGALHLESLKEANTFVRDEFRHWLWHSLSNQDLEAKMAYLKKLNSFELTRELSNKLLHPFLKKTAIDAELILRSFVKEQFPLFISTSFQDIDRVYEANKQLFSAEDLFHILQDEKLRSLLFFKNTDDEISFLREKLRKEKEQEPSPAKPIPTTSSKDYSVAILDNSRLFVPGSASSRSGYSNGGYYGPTLKEMRSRKLKGTHCEDIVFNHIKNHLGLKAIHSARENEGLHYDIEYWNDQNEHKYIEVKSLDSGKFYLTKDEYKFGNENKANYEIWLVSNSININIINDFFDSEMYVYEPDSYVVYLSLK